MRPVSFLGAVGLVAEREVFSKLRSRAFLLSTAVVALVCLAGVVISAVAFNQQLDDVPVAVTADVLDKVADLPGLEITEVADRTAAERLVTDGKVDAAIVADTGPLGYALVGDQGVPTSVLLGLSQTPPVHLLNPTAERSAVSYLVGLGFGLMFLMAASLFGTTIAQSVIEEKQTRIVEILLAAVPDRALMAGKVLGNTALAMAQVAIFLGIGIGGLLATGQGAVLGSLGAPVGWFAVYFLLGFVLLAALFAAAGALVSRQEDIGSTTFPLTMLIVAPYLLVVTLNDNPVALAVMSYVPFSAPVAMPMRLFLDQAGWWEPLLSLAILAATCAGAIRVGATIYSNALLRMGSRVRLADALRAGR
ncbi:MAG: ABC transporter permease [Propionicimonas sp.]|nr:ABC transporter permease [Propionicimonas sp.]